MEETIAGFVDACARDCGVADRRADVQGRSEIGDGGVAVHGNGRDVEGSGRAIEIERETTRACTGDGRDGADVGGGGGDTAGQGQDAGAGGDGGGGAGAVIDEAEAGEGLIEVVQVKSTRTVQGRNNAVVDLAGLIEADGGVVDFEVTRWNCDAGGAVGSREVQCQCAGVADVAIELGAAGVGVGGVEGDDRRIERGVNKAGGRAIPVVHDAGVYDCRALVLREVERGDTAALRAAGGEEAVAHRRADGLAGEVAGDDETAGVQVQRVRVVREGQRLAIGAGVEGDGVGIVSAGAADVYIGNDKRGTAETQVLRGVAGASRDDGGIVALVACRVQNGEATGRIVGGRSHIAAERAALSRPRDDAIDEQAAAIGDDDATGVAHLAGRGTPEHGSKVGLGEVADLEDCGAHAAVGGHGGGEVVLGTGQGEGTDLFVAVPEIPSRQGKVTAAHGDGRGVVDAVGVGHGAGIREIEGGIVDGDRCGA